MKYEIEGENYLWDIHKTVKISKSNCFYTNNETDNCRSNAILREELL